MKEQDTESPQRNILSRSGRPIVRRSDFDAMLFDLDGVITRTAAVHAAAWKQLFDEFLSMRALKGGEPFRPFDVESDYRHYVDGKLRYEGARSFLESRGIVLPYGTPDDRPGDETVCGLANKKDDYFQALLAQRGVEVYQDAVAFLRAAKVCGFRTAVVSASKHCAAVLESAGLAGFFEVRVDGVVSEHLHLRGKPAPDAFLEAAKRLGVRPDRAVVIEDAIAGVQAGQRGGFGLVIGVDRVGQTEALKRSGAHIVVSDMGEILVDGCGSPN